MNLGTQCGLPSDDSSDSNRYATFFFAQYDPAIRQPTYVNVGHNAPVILRPKTATVTVGPNGACEILRLEEGAPVVDRWWKPCINNAQSTIEPGDVLIGYTDGISEAMNREDEEGAEDRMIAQAVNCAHLSAQQMLECLLDAADRSPPGRRSTMI